MRSCLYALLVLAVLVILGLAGAWFLRDQFRPGGGAHRPFPDAGAPRTWTDTRGREIEAVLLAASNQECLLRVTATQTVYRLPLNRLSAPDRRHAKEWRARHEDPDMPPEVPNRFPVSIPAIASPSLSRHSDRGGPVWVSPRFEFVAYEGLDRERLQSIATICESSDRAIRRAPLPLSWARAGESRRRVHLYEDAEDYRRATGGPASFAAHYDLRDGSVHIPVSSFSGVDLGRATGRFELERRDTLDVVVHELIHQSAPVLGPPRVPAWVTEGIAEYFAAMHVSGGSFAFAHPRRQVRRYLKQRSGLEGLANLRRLPLYRLQKFCGRGLGEWNRATIDGEERGAGFIQYGQALLMTEFFCHAEGNRMRPYLEAILTGVSEERAARIHLLDDRTWSDLEEHVISRWRSQGLALHFVESPAMNADSFESEVGIESILTDP